MQFAVTFVFGNMFYVLFAFAFLSFDVVGVFLVPPAFFLFGGWGVTFFKRVNGLSRGYIFFNCKPLDLKPKY